jgi:DinB superfamily
VTPERVAALVAAAGSAIEAELGGMGDEVASWHPADGEWCVKEVLAHVMISERIGFGGRIREILAEDNPSLKATGPADRACGNDLAAMLAALAAQRAASVELIRSLGPADLDRAGIHERVGRLTINDLIHEWVHHDRAHLKQILGNVQAYAWPSMGGAQAFVQ